MKSFRSIPVTFFIIFLCIADPAFSSPKYSCKAVTSNAVGRVLEKPQTVKKELITPGAIVFVTEHIGGKNGGYPPLDKGLVIDLEGHLAGGHYAQPGDLIKVLDGPKRVNGVNLVRIKLLESDIEGTILWNWFRLSTKLLAIGETAKPKKKRKKNLKFPVKQDYKFEAIGLNRYGRSLAEIGDLVWVGNLPRVMSPAKVGRVIELADPLGPKDFPVATVELTTGKTVIEALNWVIPLERSEITSILEFYGKKVKVDWFK